jgi:four helix bundle protein
LQPNGALNSLQKAAELKKRTKSFAIRIIRLFRSLPHSPDAQTLGRQILRSGTCVAANYRAVCRARSKAEFISKMGLVVEEADETVFWLELLSETGAPNPAQTQDLLKEANEHGGEFCWRSLVRLYGHRSEAKGSNESMPQ